MNAELSVAQNNELNVHYFCNRIKDVRGTYGLVRSGKDIVFECRCEYESCEKFHQCMPNPIVRMYENIVEKPIDFTQLQYEWLGTVMPIEHVFDEPEFEYEDEKVPVAFTEAPVINEGEYSALTDPSTIITADIEAHILVNAGPGTGKTFTVIERLAHIIREGEVDLCQVLVLCYTNAAREVILHRLAEKGLGDASLQLVICTLDSLAWQNLTSRLENESELGRLFELGFNGCIRQFNMEFDPEEWADFEYLIIDELQDLVNERAKMTLKILRAVNCGYLLLGDKCQAIYDYDCNDGESINSGLFYKQLDEIMPEDTLKYELKSNIRQSETLSRRSDTLRNALLELDTIDTNEFFRDHISKLESEKFVPADFSVLSQTMTTAILTRSNGEAEWISAKLHKNCIPHTLLRSVTPPISLHRWLADMFWDFREARMGKDEFCERYMIRIDYDSEAAEAAYHALISSLPEEYSGLGYFEIDKVISALRRGQHLSPVLLNEPNEALTVSTIHKAKGREFDHVYLFSAFTPSSDNTDEARVRYVGETRPRTTLDALQKSKWHVRKSFTARWIMQGYSWGTPFCDRIVIGFSGDISQDGFVKGDLEAAIEKQSYIARQIKVNDTVEICFIDDTYLIYHYGCCIGTISDEAQESLLSSIQSLYRWSGIPPRLHDVYVKNVVTIVPHRFPSGVDAMFKESNFWLGVELTGFAKADWHWEGGF